MLKQREIRRTFRKLGLLSENERQVVLSQGFVYTELEEEPSFWLITDINTNFKVAENLNKELRDAGLE